MIERWKTSRLNHTGTLCATFSAFYQKLSTKRAATVYAARELGPSTSGKCNEAKARTEGSHTHVSDSSSAPILSLRLS